MQIFRKNLILVFSLLLLSSLVQAQETFTMKDTIVTACEGFFVDSNEGLTPGNYAHNENYTFTICPDRVDELTIAFVSFCTEATFDVLTIYEGTDTFGTVIGAYSGLTLPPTITFSGCLTFNFKSDANVACTGWLAEWGATLFDPIPPEINVLPDPPTCSTTVVTVNFVEPILCSTVADSNFTLFGPVSTTISASPTGCVGDSTYTVELTLSPGLDESGTYILDYTFEYIDACDSTWILTALDTFVVNDCPLEVNVVADNIDICPGDCANIRAIVDGGDSTSYSYAWSVPLPDSAGPLPVCPLSTTTYFVTVSDAGPAADAVGSITINVLTAPNAGVDQVVCVTDPPYGLSGTPVGGYWNGPGITDSLAGTFDPSDAGQGIHTIYYFGPNGCPDSLLITVNPVNAGPDEAACPGSPSFTVSGFSPAGGTWSGPNITPAGLFNPSTPGTFTVTYSFGSCTDTKDIIVENIVVQNDTFACEKDDEFFLTFSPPGGVWSGPGLEDPLTGEFDPDDGVIGINTLVYTLNGCSDTVLIDVTAINAGSNQTLCPKQGLYTLPAASPPGGYWTGTGILDSLTGLFDPAALPGQWNADLHYTVGGCTDQKWVYMRHTSIGVDTILLCWDGPRLSLDYTNTNRNPGGGSWSGTGEVSNFFYPDIAGPGYHTMDYVANTCHDSFTVWVMEPKNLTDTAVCELSGPFQLEELPTDPVPGGIWAGTGITDPHGTFDPAVAGIDTHMVTYQSFFGCNDTTQVIVYPLDTIYFDGLDAGYCFSDTTIPLTGFPADGSFFGIGVTDTVFNPSEAGPGLHEVLFTRGAGSCRQSVNQFVTVSAPVNLTTSVSDAEICIGAYTTIGAEASGGNGDPITFSWNNGLSPSFEHLVNPDSTTSYIVIADDGCSDPVTDTILVVVTPAFSIAFDTSEIKCFGQDGYAVVEVAGSGDYSYVWNTNPSQTGDSIVAPVARSYEVTVTDGGTGCEVVGEVRIPGYASITANFSPNPANCITVVEPTVDFLDLSSGAISGYWEFGDGGMEPYVPGTNPQHDFTALGTYIVNLYVENEGGCPDSIQKEICVIPRPLGVFNSFSPNGDGVNDFFEMEGLEDYPGHNLQIFNRYGNLIYESDDYQNDWNGRHFRSGQSLPDGAYFYIFDPGNGNEKQSGDIMLFR